NTRNQVIGVDRVSVGTLNSSAVHPRELFRNAIKRSAASIILVHNHPSGDPTPSREDVEVTGRLIDAGKIIGIDVLDHIIIGDNRFTSFKARGLL
ncbi:MAG TPA: JAB domain-containing protein, partial [Bacillota bacterium]|nr:JAB domain-containing protein [Bacillota bacterium]